MGGIVDTLFGSTEEPSVQQATTMTGDQSTLLKKLSQLLSGQLGAGVPSYPGDMTAGPSDLQTQAWDEISRLISGGRSEASGEAVNRILGGYDVGKFDPTAIQDWYKNALVTPALNTWEKDVVPKIQEKFISQNAGSSGAANRAIAGSAEDLMTGLNAELANTLFGEKSAFDTRKFQAGQSDLDRLLNVPGMEATSTDEFLKTLGIGAEAGGTQQALNQADIDALISKWTTEQPYNNPWLNLLSTALGTTSFENVVNPGSQQSGLFQDVIAPLGSSFLGTEAGAASLASLFSSKRHKKNIVKIGKPIVGLQPVEFEYTEKARAEHPGKTLPGRVVGFLAEDVAEKFPEAVIFDQMGRPDGINYQILLQVAGG